MPDLTLTVPARHADDFRAALAHELRDEAGYVKKERKKLLEAQAYEREDAHDGVAFGLARMEDPCESPESVTDRAFDAAKLVFEGFHGQRLYAPRKPEHEEGVA